MEDILNKKIAFYNLWWLLALPVLVVCLFTAVTSFLTLNYEYLPAETDFLAVLFYDLSYVALDAALCLCLGAFCYALYERKALAALVTALVTLFNAGLVPMIMFFVRSFFIASGSSSQIMEEYFSVDVYSAVANTLKMLAGILLALVVMAVYFFGKIEKPIVKPYLAPKSEPAVSALVLVLANVVFITLSFTFGEEYDFGALALQLVFAVASYFLMMLGVYSAQKKYNLCQPECKNGTKSIDKEKC